MDNEGSALWLIFMFACLAWCGASLLVAAVLGAIFRIPTPKPPQPTDWSKKCPR